MRLKSLQIKGFKSFANDTVLNFEHDVIGIVGPNGSGKSNIVDAMRWVLGEQKNKDLRLENMKDIIFNGTAKRKKAHKAEVSVTFDNSKSILPTPFNTVKITRRLFQTGESEYALNDVKCRLKDIQNLFIDSGIGSNSYAIIELGMVDDILLDKDNARRRMFEQAAGISKYKKRKKESLQKLQLTTEDMERLEDLLAEIKSNLDQLRKQARKAAKYKAVKEERRDKVLTFKKLELAQILNKRTSNEKLLEKAKDSYHTANASLRKLDAKIESLKKDHIAQEKKLSESQKGLAAIMDEIAHLESDRKLSAQQIKFSEENMGRIQADIKRWNPEIQLLQKKKEALEVEIDKIEQELLTMQKQLKSVEEDYELLQDKILAHNQVLEQHQQERQKLSNNKYTLEKEIALLQAKILQRKELENNLELRLKELIHGMGEKVTRRKELEKLKINLKKEIELLSSDELSQRSEEIKYTNEIDGLEKKISVLMRKQDAATHEKALLASMIESMEGFPTANKYILQHIDADLPILSEIIQINEEFRIAIESYLDPFLNYFIVPNRKKAMDIIEQMTNAQKGRVSFFILEQFEGLAKACNIVKGSSALELVTCDSIYNPLIHALLHHVYIISGDYNPETEIKNDVDSNIILLSKDGNFILGENYISGGSVGLFEGKRTGRKKQLEKIAAKIAQLKIEITETNNLIKARRLKLFSLNLKSILELKQQKLSELQELKYKFDLNDHDIDALNQENESIKEKIKKIHGEFQDDEETISLKNKALKACLDALIELEQNIGNRANVKDNLSADYTALSQNLNQQKLSVVKIENKLQQLLIEKEHFNKSIHDLQRQLEIGQKELLQLEEKKANASQSLIKCEDQLVNKYNEKETFTKDLNAFEQAYFNARGEIHQWEEEQKKLNRIQQQDQLLVNQYKDVLVALRFEREKIEERVRVEFNEQIHNWKIPESLMGIDKNELEIEVDRLEKKLQSFSEVNPLALEAYEELELRYENILKQRDDILAAKEDLLNTIKEIENKATRLFLDAFEEVRKYFVKVFRSLFTEDDDCDLVLLDPSDPLNSEIEILAKPKGKRPKSLSQLSGGEKTLTATALLFSLYLLKPAPFCIFDEVDAPLDDNNVQKFGNIIRAFSKESQFLMITHNKLTMAEVDILYGIFMQEKGISQVAPVDLTMLAHENRIGELLK